MKNHSNKLFTNVRPSAICATFILPLILQLAFLLVVAIPIMFLWNWLMPAIFSLTEITYFQAFGILLLFHLFADSYLKVKFEVK